MEKEIIPKILCRRKFRTEAIFLNIKPDTSWQKANVLWSKLWTTNIILHVTCGHVGTDGYSIQHVDLQRLWSIQSKQKHGKLLRSCSFLPASHLAKRRYGQVGQAAAVPRAQQNRWPSFQNELINSINFTHKNCDLGITFVFISQNSSLVK